METDMKKQIEKNVEAWVASHLKSSFQFRKFQKETIVDIIYNILTAVNHQRSDNSIQYPKVQLVEAPTGSGKSLIVLICAGVLDEYYKRTSYILCSDLYLYSQYEKFIKDNKLPVGFLKGQTGNYKCQINQQDIRNADCRMSKMVWGDLYHKAKQVGYDCALSCQYCKERQAATKAKVTLMTYQLFFFQLFDKSLPANSRKHEWELTAPFVTRDVVFCDECHNIPDLIHLRFGATFNQHIIDKMKEVYEMLYNRYMSKNLFDKEDNPDQESCFDKYPTWESVNEVLTYNFNVLKKEDLTQQEIWKAFYTIYRDVLEHFKKECEKLENKIKSEKDKAKADKKPFPQKLLEEYKLVTWQDVTIGTWRDLVVTITGTDPDEAFSNPDESGKYLVREREYDKDKKTWTIKFYCAREDYIINEFLLNKAENIVMLSATIGDKESFDDNIGVNLDGNKYSTMRVIPSSFDFEKSPVYYSPKYKMTKACKENSFPHIMEMTLNICDKYKGMHGIIQTGSYENAKMIYAAATPELKRRLLMYQGSKDKEEKIVQFKQTTDTILIGPTLNEGIDLPDDLCRFIIICKVPYPYLGSALVRKKAELFPLWYNSKTSSEIIQGIGRGVRNNHDWCVTYILDGSFQYLYYKTKSQYSKELRQRIKQF